MVATGVSLNLGIPGLCLEAVNLGYRVVVATGAVAGIPVDYADAVLANTISLLAARVTTEELEPGMAVTEPDGTDGAPAQSVTMNGMGLSGRTAVVTGGAGGIGRRICADLAGGSAPGW